MRTAAEKRHGTQEPNAHEKPLTRSRARGTEPLRRGSRGSRTHGVMRRDRTRNIQAHTCPRFTRSMTLTRPQTTKAAWTGRRLSRKLVKTAYICADCRSLGTVTPGLWHGAHDCPTTPVRPRPRQLKYTTAFMTRDECTHGLRFVNEKFRVRWAPYQRHPPSVRPAEPNGPSAIHSSGGSVSTLRREPSTPSTNPETAGTSPYAP